MILKLWAVDQNMLNWQKPVTVSTHWSTVPFKTKIKTKVCGLCPTHNLVKITSTLLLEWKEEYQVVMRIWTYLLHKKKRNMLWILKQGRWEHNLEFHPSWRKEDMRKQESGAKVVCWSASQYLPDSIPQTTDSLIPNLSNVSGQNKL